MLTLEECERETILIGEQFLDSWSSIRDENNFLEISNVIGAEAFTVKKQAVIKAIRDAAPKGKKDEAEERFMKELRAAGCVKNTKFEKIVCRKGD